MSLWFDLIGHVDVYDHIIWEIQQIVGYSTLFCLNIANSLVPKYTHAWVEEIMHVYGINIPLCSCSSASRNVYIWYLSALQFVIFNAFADIWKIPGI